MRVKICGITQLDQALAIAPAGATDIGFICVPKSPRYITPDAIRPIVDALPKPVQRVGVFMDLSTAELLDIVQRANLSAIQLHGQESPEFCQKLRSHLQQLDLSCELIKAIRVRSSQSLQVAQTYSTVVDILLLDAYHPQLAGGTGQTIDWTTLQRFQPDCSWWLAGGLTPDNIQQALQQVQPDGIDVSSGVERSPGNKDLGKVAQLFTRLGRLVDIPETSVGVSLAPQTENLKP